MIDISINNNCGSVRGGRRRNFYSYNIQSEYTSDPNFKRDRDTSAQYRYREHIPFYRNIRHTHVINLSQTTV